MLETHVQPYLIYCKRFVVTIFKCLDDCSRQKWPRKPYLKMYCQVISMVKSYQLPVELVMIDRMTII